MADQVLTKGMINNKKADIVIKIPIFWALNSWTQPLCEAKQFF